MRIRPAEAADAAALVALTNPVIAASTVTFTTEPRSITAMTSTIADRPGCFFVAETGGRVAGYATAFPFRAGPGYARTREHTILLADSARGRGIGRQLMARLEQALAAAGVHVLVAGISGENPDAVAFHAALGFVEVGRLPDAGHKFGRYIDLVLMQKLLPGAP